MRPLLWGLLATLVLCVGLYAAVPWLVPRHWLADRLRRALSDATGRRVHVERVLLGWREGVVVEGLAIPHRSASTDGALLTIGRLRCALTPLTTWWTGRVDRLEITEADFRAVIGADNSLRLSNPGPGKRAEGLPTNDWLLNGFRLHVISDLPDQPEITVDVGSLACRLDPATGRMEYQADATLARAGVRHGGRIRGDGQLLVPSLNPRVSLSGGTRFEWKQLDLVGIPVWLWPALGMERLDGRSEGRLVTRTDEERGLIFDLDVKLEDTRVQWRGMPEGDDFGDASLLIAGSYKADTQQLVLNRCRYEIPGMLLLQGPREDRAALTYTPFDRTSLRLDLGAQTPDLGRLLATSAASQLLGRPATTLTGPARVGLVVVHGVDETRYSLLADATEAAGDFGAVLHHEAGVPARLGLEGVYQPRAQTLLVDSGTVRLGDALLTLSGTAPTSGLTGDRVDLTEWLIALLERGELSAELGAGRVEEIVRLFPPIGQRLQGLRLAGPASVRIEQRRSLDRQRLVWRLSLPEGFSCQGSRWVDKPAHMPWEMNGQWSYALGRDAPAGGLGLSLTCGRGRVTVDPEASSWRAAIRRVPGTGAEPATGAEAYAQLNVELEYLEELTRCLPWLGEYLAEVGGGSSGVAGACNVSATLNASLTPHRQQWRVAGRVVADELQIELGRAFRKSAGTRSMVTAGWLHDRRGQTASGGLDIDLELPAGRGRAAWRWSEGAESCDAAVSVTDADAWLRYMPAVNEAAQPHQVQGSAWAEVRAARRGDALNGEMQIDLSGTGFVLPGEVRMAKRPGILLTAKTGFELVSPRSSHGHWQLDVRDLAVKLGATEALLPAVRMRLSTDPPAEATGSRPLSVEDLVASVLSRGQLTLEELAAGGSLRLTMDGSLSTLNDRLAEWIARYDVAGSATGSLEVSYGRGRDWALAWSADGSRLHVNAAPDWMKSAGIQATTSGRMRLRAGPIPETAEVEIEQSVLHLGQTRLSGSGWADLLATPAGLTVRDWRCSGEMEALRLEEWPAVRPRLAAFAPRGGGRIAVRCRKTADGFSIEAIHAALEQAAFRFEDVDLSADGAVVYDGGYLATDGLRVRAGPSDVTLVGGVNDLLGSPQGEVLLRADVIDLDALAALVDQARNVLATDGPSRSAPGLGVRSTSLGELFKRASLRASVRVAKLWFTEPGTGRRFLVDELSGHLSLLGSRLTWPLRCCLNGGLVEGTVIVDQSVDPPVFALDYQALAVAPADAGTGVDVRPYLELTFPGLVPTGPVTLVDGTRQRLLDPQHPDNYPLGSGELIIEGGVVTGKAAPDYVTQLLPQLDFARFEFERMHDWFDKRADGRVHHHMIFRGPIYHIYADGYSTADRRIHYEVGVDFLASFDKKSWATSGQGRLPLFTKDGRIGPDGKLLNERVRYVPLWKLANSVFVSNTLIETSYLALREQLRRASR